MELRIKELAKAKGVSIVSLARMVGITQPNMSNLANGKATPSLETLEKIANALNVSISDFFVQPNTDTASLTCPRCGKSINIKAD